MATLPRRLLAEALGTFLFLFFACGAAVVASIPGSGIGLSGVAFVHAVALGLGLALAGTYTGGHLNPAFTAAMLVGKRVSARDAGLYVAMQLVGGVAAVAVLNILMPSAQTSAVNLGTPTIASFLTLPRAIAIEALLAFLFMSAFYGISVAAKRPALGSVSLALVLFCAVLVGGPLTGAALNPVRAFAPALVSGTWVAQIVWWIGPILGASLAAVVWEKVMLEAA